jgi:hypothetical protein
MLAGLTVLLMIAFFVYAFVAFAEAELAWMASVTSLWPWVERMRERFGRITAPGKELVLRVWPDAGDNTMFTASVVGLGSLVLAFLLLLAALRAFA